MIVTHKINGELVKLKPPTSASIENLASKMIDGVMSGSLDEQECPVTHRFADGCYLREIFMPEGTLIVGKVHATRHFNVILKGVVSVATTSGVETLEAPCTFISDAGVQKVVFCHSDCIWQTIHVTEKTDLKEIEAEVINDTKNNSAELIKKLEGFRLCRGD